MCAVGPRDVVMGDETDRARVHQMPVGRYLSTAHPEEKYAIILMDPPYADPLIEGTIRAVSASGLLDDEGLLIVGHSPRVTLADDYEPLHRRKFRRLRIGGIPLAQGLAGRWQ